MKLLKSGMFLYAVFAAVLGISTWSRADLINHWAFDEAGGTASATDSAGTLDVALQGDADFVNDAAIPATNQWQYWTFVRDERTASLYVDGELVEVLFDYISYASISTNGELRIGRQYGANLEYLHGRMSDMAFWDEALAPWQITNAMQNGAQAYNDNPPSALINYWKFDEADGTPVAADVAGGLHAILQGDADFTNDVTRGQVLELDGAGDYAYNLNEPFTNDTVHTLGVWVKHYDDPTTGTERWISWGNSSGRYYIGPDNTTNGGRIKNGYGNQTTEFLSEGSKPETNVWQYWTFVRDGATLTLYIDGGLVEVINNAVNLSAISVSGVLSIGRQFNSGEYFHGQLSDMAIWSEALAPWQIRNAMENGALAYNENPPDTNLIHHWKLDETTGKAIAEDVIGGLNAVLKGNAVFTNDATRGQVMELDGDGDYAANSGEPFTSDTTHTLGLWIKYISNPVTDNNRWISWGTGGARYFIGPWGGKVTAGIGSANLTYTDTASLLVTDTWQYWTFVREGTSARLYLNGELVQDLTVGVSGAIATGGELRIGYQYTSDEYVDGRMSDVAIWNVALTEKQIKYAMLRGAENYDYEPPLGTLILVQ